MRLHDTYSPNPRRPILRVRDLAARWGCSRQTIHAWRRAGRIPEPIRIGQNGIGWKLEAVEALEETGVVGGVGPSSPQAAYDEGAV